MPIRLTGTNGNDILTAAAADRYVLEGLDGDDQLFGGAFSDGLYGGAGNDVLDGGGAADLLDGGAGADQLIGGAGDDTATYAGSSSGVRVNLATGRGSGGDAQGDVLSGIENLSGSGFSDTLIGDGAGNRLRGGAGADFLDGGAGTDTADYSEFERGVTVNLQLGLGWNGDAQGDRLVSIENVTGSWNDDVIVGDAGANALNGNWGDDRIFGGAGGDDINGGFGNDIIEGGAGADQIHGFFGRDTASYAASNAGVKVNLTTGLAAGGHAQGDVLSHIEDLTGSNFGDQLTGTSGDNIIQGGNGNDTIRGGAGADQIWGGAGDDLFVFDQNDQPVAVAGTNFEYIGDFVAGGSEDVIDLSNAGTGYTSLADVLAHSLQWGQGTLIDLGPSGTVCLDGVQMTNLAASDFIFV